MDHGAKRKLSNSSKNGSLVGVVTFLWPSGKSRANRVRHRNRRSISTSSCRFSSLYIISFYIPSFSLSLASSVLAVLLLPIGHHEFGTIECVLSPLGGVPVGCLIGEKRSFQFGTFFILFRENSLLRTRFSVQKGNRMTIPVFMFTYIVQSRRKSRYGIIERKGDYNDLVRSWGERFAFFRESKWISIVGVA